MQKWVLEEKNYIAFAVTGCLVRGMIYHFFPLINPILTAVLLVWPLILFGYRIYHRRLNLNRIQIVLIGFLAAACIGTVLNLDSIKNWEFGDPMESFYSLYIGLSLVLFMFGFPGSQPKESEDAFINRLFLFVWGYIILLGAGSVVLLWFYRLGIDLPGGIGSAEHIFTYGHMGEETRFCGLFGYSNAGGNLCAMAVPLAFYLAEQKKIPVWLAALSAALLVYTIILLDVRTSMVALLLCIVLIGFRILQKKTRTGRAVLICFLALILFGAALVILKRDTILGYWHQYQDDPRKTIIFLTTGRSEYWELAVQGYLIKPLFGYGWLNNAYIGFYFDNHNLFFNLLLWTGTIGTGLFAAAFIMILHKMVRADYTNRFGLLLAWAAVFVQAMLDRAIMGTANASAETMIFWIICGILVSRSQIKQNNK